MTDEPTVPALIVGAGDTQIRLKTTEKGEPLVVFDRRVEGEWVPTVGLVFTNPDVAFATLENLAEGIVGMLGGKMRGRVH